MKTPKTYRLSDQALNQLEDLKKLDYNRYCTETGLIELAITELWISQYLLGIDQPSKALAQAAKAGD